MFFFFVFTVALCPLRLHWLNSIQSQTGPCTKAANKNKNVSDTWEERYLNVPDITSDKPYLFKHGSSTIRRSGLRHDTKVLKILKQMYKKLITQTKAYP